MVHTTTKTDKMQRVRYNLTMNGFINQMFIQTEIQPIIDNTIQVHISITGICDTAATLNLITRILTPAQPITVSSYKNNGQDKTFTKFKIPKEQLLQIKDFVTPMTATNYLPKSYYTILYLCGKGDEKVAPHDKILTEGELPTK